MALTFLGTVLDAMTAGLADVSVAPAIDGGIAFTIRGPKRELDVELSNEGTVTVEKIEGDPSNVICLPSPESVKTLHSNTAPASSDFVLTLGCDDAAGTFVLQALAPVTP